MRAKKALLFAAATSAALALALALAAPSAGAAGLFTLSSTTFADGQTMPQKVANSKANVPANPNCVGDNVSPQLSWTGTPDGTKSFAIIMVDHDGRAGAGYDHWIAYGIPVSVTGFAEGEVSNPSDKYVGGKNSLGLGFYSGPCPPATTSTHHYTFTLIATDLDPKDLPPGLTKDELLAKIGPPPATHAKGVAGLAGLFAHPK
jgi:Raf kinase inhibitor-like YbhB/YbcL family protein